MDFLFDILSDEDRGFYREAGLKFAATAEEVADLILRTDLAPDTKWAKNNPRHRAMLVTLLSRLVVNVPSSKWMWRWVVSTEKRKLVNSPWRGDINDFMNYRGNWVVSQLHMIERWMPTLKEHNVKITLSEWDSAEDLRDELEEIFGDIQRQEEIQNVIWDGRVVHKFKNGWYVLQLGSTDDMAYEGDFMNNCLGSHEHSHPQALEEGLASYFSLRDPKGVPHVSIAVDNSDSEIIEIQGRSNSTPKPEYVDMIKDFIDHSWVNYSAYPSTGHLRDVPELNVEPEHNPDWDEWHEGNVFYISDISDLYHFQDVWQNGAFYASEEPIDTITLDNYYYYVYQQGAEVSIDVSSVLEEIQDFSLDDDNMETVDQAQHLFIAMALESIQQGFNIFDMAGIEEISPVVAFFFQTWLSYLDEPNWRAAFPYDLQDSNPYPYGRIPWPALPTPPAFPVISRRMPDTVRVVLDGTEQELEILDEFVPDWSVGIGGNPGLVLFSPTPSLLDADDDYESILFLEEDGTLYRGEEVVGFKADDPRRRRRGSQTNWETWNVKLTMDNDESLWNESREIARSGTIEDLRDWAIVNIIAPHNVEAIESAKKWNSIPSEERIDPLFEDLRERSPGAADIVDQLGFGPDVDDETPRVIDPELVNWNEIFESLLDELDEDAQYEQHMERLKGMGLAWTNNGPDNNNIMRDAFYRFYGAIPDAHINDPNAYNNIYIHLSGQDVIDGATQYRFPEDYLTQDTRAEIWEIERSNSDSTKIQELIKADPKIREIMERGLDIPLFELADNVIGDILGSQSNPYIPTMVDALEARGYSSKEIDQIMKPVRKWDGENWVELDTVEKEEVDPDGPSDSYFPQEWLSAIRPCPDLGPVLQEFIVDSPFVKVAQDDLPHYPDAMYGWKILDIHEDGRLYSPHQGTVWPSGQYLEANKVPDKNQGGFNIPGIHAVMDEKMGLLRDYVSNNSALVKIAMVGKIVEHNQGYRCQFAYPSEIYLTNLDKANLVRAKYPGVEVSLMEESHGEAIGLVSAIYDINGNELYRSRPNITLKLVEEAVNQGVSLRGANLERANLWGADLEGANLQEAHLGRADLRWANLQEADLQGANLEGASLAEASLERADLGGADLRRANLQWANLQEAHLEGADLKRANLEGAYLEGANLKNVNLEGAKLAGTLGLKPKTTSIHPISVLYLDGQLYFGPTYGAIANQIRPRGEEWKLWQDGLWGQILAGEENQIRWDSAFSPKHLITEAMAALKKEYRDVKLWERDAALVKQFGDSDGIIDDHAQEKVATPRQEGSLPQDDTEAQETLPQTAGQIEHIWPDSDDILEAYYAVIEASGDEDLGFRDFGLLEGALGATQMAYQYGAYGDIFDLAADLINKLQRQQAILNANKRTSSAVGFQFLEDNGWETGGISDDEALEDEFIRLVYGLSDSTEEERTTVEELAAFLREVCTPGADQSISPVKVGVADTFQTGPSQLRQRQLHDPFILLGDRVYFGSDYPRPDLLTSYSYHPDLLDSLLDEGILVEDSTNAFGYHPIPEVFGWVYRDKGTPRDTGDGTAYGFDSDFALGFSVTDNDLVHEAVKAKYPNAKFISEPVQKSTTRIAADINELALDMLNRIKVRGETEEIYVIDLRTFSYLKRYSPQTFKLWPWLFREYKRGNVNSGPRHVRDILTQLTEWLEYARSRPQIETPDINRFAWGQAESWVYEMNASKIKDDRQYDSAVPVFEWPDGWKIVQLTSEHDLALEGDLMGHCVGGYSLKMISIYSLRDPRGAPHATIGIVPNDGRMDLIEVQGKGNLPPISEYKEKVKKWTKTLPLGISLEHIMQMAPVDLLEHGYAYFWDSPLPDLMDYLPDQPQLNASPDEAQAFVESLVFSIRRELPSPGDIKRYVKMLTPLYDWIKLDWDRIESLIEKELISDPYAVYAEPVREDYAPIFDLISGSPISSSRTTKTENHAVRRIDVDENVPIHSGWKWRQPLIYDGESHIVYVGPSGSHHYDLLGELRDQGVSIKSPEFGLINLTTGEWLFFYIQPKKILDEIDEVLPGFFYVPPKIPTAQ